jgi:transcriptional regulator with XRE-family HTH domain
MRPSQDPCRIRLGKAITAARFHRQMTQRDLARILGIAQPSISAWELGKTYPSPPILLLLARVLDLDLRTVADPPVGALVE